MYTWGLTNLINCHLLPEITEHCVSLLDSQQAHHQNTCTHACTHTQTHTDTHTHIQSQPGQDCHPASTARSGIHHHLCVYEWDECVYEWDECVCMGGMSVCEWDECVCVSGMSVYEWDECVCMSGMCVC